MGGNSCRSHSWPICSETAFGTSLTNNRRQRTTRMPGYNKIGSAKTILFVDGEQRLRQSLSRSLRTSGYHLMVASDGEEAIKISLEFKEAIHLLLANVEMPDMTGIELAQRITRMRPDTKVSLLLGLDSGVLVLDHGWQFLPAPFAADLLRTRILEILKE